MNVEEVRAYNSHWESDLLAVVVRAGFAAPGLTFFSTPDQGQQLAFMRHPVGHVIDAHVHPPVPRQVRFTREVLLVRKGRLRADLYDHCRVYVRSVILGPGDVLLLVSGGHGFECLDECEFFECKNGPYPGDGKDKIRFQGVDRASVRTA